MLTDWINKSHLPVFWFWFSSFLLEITVIKRINGSKILEIVLKAEDAGFLTENEFIAKGPEKDTSLSRSRCAF